MEPIGFAAPDEAPCCIVAQEDFKGRNTAFFIPPWQELLSDDGLKCIRELQEYLVLLTLREVLQDAVGGLDDISGVERREDEMAGLCGRDGGMDGIRVAHLTYQDNVGVLSESGPESCGKAGAIPPYLALDDKRLVAFVLVLDGVFNRDDAFLLRLVYGSQECGNRSGLPVTSRRREQDEAVVFLCKRLYKIRETEVVHARDGAWEQTDGCAKAQLRAERVGAAPDMRPGREGKIQVPHFLESHLLCTCPVRGQEAFDG